MCTCIHIYIYTHLYIHIPGTQMTLVLIGKGLVLEGWPSKIEVIWVPGIYIYHINTSFRGNPINSDHPPMSVMPTVSFFFQISKSSAMFSPRTYPKIRISNSLWRNSWIIWVVGDVWGSRSMLEYFYTLSLETSNVFGIEYGIKSSMNGNWT